MALGDLLPNSLLLDGGMGTALMARGLKPQDEPADAWNLSHPNEVRQIHEDFRRAGAGALQTNTFGANRLRLAASGREDQAGELNLLGAKLAREVAGDELLVIGSMGPTGALPPPEGNASLYDLELAFAEQAAYLVQGGVDLLHVETMYHPKEARAAIRGCRIGAPDTPVVASMSVRLTKAPNEYMTHIGFTADSIIQVFVEERVDGVGVNCTLTPTDILPLVRNLKDACGAPVFAKPTIAPDGGAPLYPQEFASGVRELFDSGARAVGGCCGTSASDIAAAAEAMGVTTRVRTEVEAASEPA